jgi:hypothetical protein
LLFTLFAFPEQKHTIARHIAYHSHAYTAEPIFTSGFKSLDSSSVISRSTRNSREVTRKGRCGAVAIAALLAALAFAGCGKSDTVSRAVSITLTPAGPVAIDPGQSVTFQATVSNDVTNSGVSWLIYNTSATSNPPCSLPSCGTLKNATHFGVTYVAPKNIQVVTSITLQATANEDTNTTVTATIGIQIAPTITTLQLPSGQNGVPYNQTIAASGGVSPLTFTLSSGALPPGLTLATNGVISGTPTSSGSSAFTVKVTDAGIPPFTISQGYTITVAPAPPLSIPAVTLQQGVTGTPYSATISARGGIPPLTWSLLSGNLPPGLTLTTNTQTGGTQPPTTGEVAGIPTTPGTYSFAVQVHDSAIPEQTATQTVSITITNPTPLAITTASLPNGVTAQGYNSPVQASGGVAPLTWSITGGLLPPGLTLNASNGVMSGTPQRVGTSTFTVKVTDSQQPAVSASKTYSITITANGTINNNELLFNGPYAFFFNGFGGIGGSSEFPEFVVGQLTANGTGGITSGTEDIHSSSVESGISFTGTYTMGADGRGTMTLTVSPTVGVTIIQTFALAFDAEGGAQFIETDTTGNRGSGIMKPQTTAAFAASSFSGNYAFQFAGYLTPPNRTATVGQFHADGVGTLSSGSAVVNNSGTVTSFNGVTGSFGGISAAGRGSASLFFTPNTLNYTFYLVSNSEAFFIATTITAQGGNTANTLPTAGIALLESGGPFSNQSLSGQYVVTGTGTKSNQDQSVFGALMSMTPGNGNGSATTDAFVQNDGGTVTTALPAAEVYGITSFGEINFTGGTSRLKWGYLVSPSLGLFIGQDAEVTFGRFEQQTGATTWGLTNIEGQYTLGSPIDVDLHDTNVSGVPASDGNGGIGGRTDSVNGSGTLALGTALTGNYTVGTNGVGTLTPGSGEGLPSQLQLFIVSPEKVRLVSSTSTDSHPQIYIFDY